MPVAPAIHIKKASPLSWRAGTRAMSQIHKEGLQPADIALIPGAAGGPKALVLTGLDQAIFADWLPRAPRLRHLVGSSIGAWRFVCAVQADARAAIALLAQRYTDETYGPSANANDVACACRLMIADLLQGGAEKTLNHAQYALTITTVRARGLLASETKSTQLAGVLAAATANVVSRKLYAMAWARVWFSDPRHTLPPLASDFPTEIVPLSTANLIDALHATAAIPLVVAGVLDPLHAPPGRYRDGGLMDYHMDLPYPKIDGLVLYPHFYEHIVPGWFDKSLRWRRPHPKRLDNVVLVSPSRDWVARLPHGKIPDRGDFRRFGDADRQRYWRQVTAESERLGEDFLRTVESDKLIQALQPF